MGEDLERKRARQREYNSNPANRARRREREASPERKAARAAWNVANKEKRAADARLRNSRPEVKEQSNARQRQDRLTVRGRARHMIRSAKHRALKNGLEFDLTVEWAIHQIENTVCPYTMQPFILTSGRNPWAPSIDRTDNLKGYTLENCAIVSLWWNVAKNEWSSEITARALYGLKQVLEDMEFVPP